PHHATPVPLPPPTGTPQPLPQPTPVPLLDLPEGTVNVLLLGADQSSRNGEGLADVIIVVSINPEIPSVSLLSIPRDLYVWIPGYGFGKINTTERHAENYPGGGPALLKATIEYNLGIPIHYYARVNFDGFVRIVDTLGGVDVPVECELHDTFPDPANPEQGIDVDFYPGIQHLDGYHALFYVRSRWSTHDFDRNRRQQQVLRALYRQVLALDVIPRIPELWGAIQETVETDLGLNELLWLGWIGSRLDWANVKSRFITPPYVTPSTAPNGAYILLQIPDAVQALIAEALQPPAQGRAGRPAFRVEVWDGTGRPGMLDVAVERLRWEGFDVVSATTVDTVYPRTQIVDFTTTSKGSPLWLLMRLYRRENSDVVRQPTEGSPVDFRIILGADYDPCVSMYQIQYVPPPTPTPTPTPTPGP
ncbi:MAG TPA: LCP family protein, partial [Thermoflexia bacterium]|nr:LCP family protein [Thermoflexia bacterium]